MTALKSIDHWTPDAGVGFSVSGHPRKRVISCLLGYLVAMGEIIAFALGLVVGGMSYRAYVKASTMRKPDDRDR
jgi:hypothetical protein